MVSDAAKKGLEQLFIRASTSHLGVGPSDRVMVEAIPAYRDEAIEEAEFYILTIANFFFKVLVIFHTQPDEKTKAYFSRSESGLGFEDVFPEICNLCCGALNRELGAYFHHLGMSTPDCLGRDCLAFLNLLRPAHTARFRIDINDGAVSLHATLCVCAYRPLDFRIGSHPSVMVTAPETGVLELF